MPTTKATLITHPMRARILSTLMGRQLTIQQIDRLLPDVPLSSIYRHVRLLVEGGVLEPVDEVRVHGALTKVYAVRRGESRIGPADTQDASTADHLMYFTTFTNTLADMFRGYLQQPGADPAADPLHALVEPLHLSPEEHREFMVAFRELLSEWTNLPPGGDRRRLVFAHALFPDLPDPPLPGKDP
jgi:DNA-binding transcriptional ArsR family regulator